jgi:ribosomal protein S18
MLRRLVTSIKPSAPNRSFHLATLNQIKSIEKIEDKKSNALIIEGKYLQENDKNLFKYDDSAETIECPLSKLEKMGIYVQHYDVLILRQFLKEDGTLLPRKVTNLCFKQYKKLRVLVKHAKNAGLLMNLQPNLLNGQKPSMNPELRMEDLKWNRHYDDYEVLKRTQKYF